MTHLIRAIEPTSVGDDSPTALPDERGHVGTSRKKARFRLASNWGLVIGVVWLTVVVLLAVLANVLPLKDPTVDAGVGIRVRPFTILSEPLGTDTYARSIMSRLIFGARASLVAGVGAATIAFVLGLAIGVLAGYRRGRTDALVGVVIDAVLAFPGIVVLVVTGATLGAGLQTVTLGLAIVSTPLFARLARANTMRIAPLEYVVAARGLGVPAWKVVLREIVPNVVASMVAYAGVILGVLILAESTVSFLGLGVALPTPSWGNMIAEGKAYLRTDAYLVIVPAAALIFTILAINHIAEWLRKRSETGAKI